VPDTSEVALDVITVRNKEEAIKLVRHLPERIFVDIESRVSEDSPDMLTAWHKNYSIICGTVGYVDHYGKWKFLTVAKSALSPEFWETLLRDRVFEAFNVYHELQSIWAHTGVNPFAYLKGWGDTFLKFALEDQSILGNSLKKRAELH
jgi:hypothetical protein